MTEPDEDDIQTDAAIDRREMALSPQSQALSNALPAQQAPVGPQGTFNQQLNSPQGNQYPSNVPGQVYVPMNQNQPLNPAVSQPLLLQHLHGGFTQQHQPAAQHWSHHPGQAPGGHYPMYSGPQQGYPGYQCAMNQLPNTPSQYHPTPGQVPYSQHSQQQGFVPQNQHPMGHQYQYPSGAQIQPLATVPIYQREEPARPPSFTGVPPTTEHFDAALVFAKKDEDLADEIVEKMNNLELKDGYKPKVCCSDRDDFGANAVVKAKPMLKVCTLIFVVLTKNLKEDEAAAVIREEAIGMTRLAPKEDCDDGRRYCVRPLHTLSPEERRGVYSVPCGLTSIDAIDWYKFGNKSFNRRLKQTFEYFLPYRLKREREQTPSSRSALCDILSSPNVNLNYQRMPNSNVQPQFQQWQQSYANMNSSQQYSDGSITVHPSIPMFSANPSNNTSLSPSQSESTTGSVEHAQTTGPSGQTAESRGSGELREPSHDDSSGSHERNIVTGGGVASDLTNQSNVAHPLGSSSRVSQEDNVTSQSGAMVRPTRLPQDNHTSSRSNQEPCPATGTSQAAVGRSVVSAQTLGKKVSGQSAAAQSGDLVENVPVSTLHARVGGDSEASHGATSVQNPNSSQQVNPESRINAEQTTPTTSSLPTEVDKDSGAESLPMAHTAIVDSKTDSEMQDDSARPRSDKLTGLKSRSAPAARSPPASSDPEQMARSQKARTPGDGQEREHQPVYRPTQTMETTVRPAQKLETYSKEYDEAVSKVRYSGPAYTSAKCAGANDSHLENTGVSREASATATQVVHHYHHFSGANPSAGQTDTGQIADPNLVLPDQLLQGIGQAVHQDRVPPRRTEAAQDRIGETSVHLDTTAPINIVDCKYVQIGRGQINIRSAQPETPDRSDSETNDGADDDDDDDDDTENDENNMISATVDCPSSAPPPYSQHDPRGGPNRTPAPFQTELKQRDTGFFPGVEVSGLVGSTQTKVKEINTRSDPRTEGSGVAGSSQTEVKQRLTEHMSPSNTSQGSSNSQTAVKRKFTVSGVQNCSEVIYVGSSDSSKIEIQQRVSDAFTSQEPNEGHAECTGSQETSGARPNIRDGQLTSENNRSAGHGQAQGEAQAQGTPGSHQGLERHQAVMGTDQKTARVEEVEKPAVRISSQDYIGMIPDGGYPSHVTSVGVSVNLQNRGQLVGGQQGNLGQGQQCQKQNPPVSPREDKTDRLSTGTPQVERGELTEEDLPIGQGDSSSSYFLESLDEDCRFLVEAADKVDIAESKGDNSMQPIHHSRSMHTMSSTNEEKSVSRMRSPNKRRQDVFLTAGTHCIKNQTQKQPELPSHYDELD